MSVDIAETTATPADLPMADPIVDPISELSGYFFEDLEVGMKAAYARTIGPADLVMFAGISGDTNPMHLNEEYAAATMFESEEYAALIPVRDRGFNEMNILLTQQM